MDTKKTVGRTAKAEARPVSKAPERNSTPPISKRPSAPPPAVAKKSGRSIPPLEATPSTPPPAVAHGAHAANDNDRAKKVAPAIPRGRLPTGSLHTEAREPAQADRLKQQLTALMNAQQKLAELKRSTTRNFFEIGELLHRIRDQRLFEVKGYGSFEAYVERETNLGQQFCAQAVRIFEVFQPAAAHALGFARLAAALAALEDEQSGLQAVDSLRGARPAIPPHKL